MRSQPGFKYSSGTLKVLGGRVEDGGVRRRDSRMADRGRN